MVDDGHMHILKCSLKNCTVMGLESTSLVSTNTSKCWTSVGRRGHVKMMNMSSSRNDEIMRANAVIPSSREASLALHQKVKTHHDGVTVKYCSPTQFRATGNTTQAVKTTH